MLSQRFACRRWSIFAWLGLSSFLAFLLLSLLLVTVGRPGLARAAPWPASGRATQAPATATWTDFFPAGWSTVLPLASGVTVYDPEGLDPASAAYRTSTTGGASWTGWGTAGLTASGVGTTTVAITVTSLVFPNSQSQNLIQFRLRSLANLTQTSPSYVIPVDTAPPGPPFGLRSSPNTWTNVNHFSETWSNPDDLSGIAGAYYLLDREPAFATDGTFVSTTNTISDIQVPGDGAHNIFIWLQDAAGNVTHLARNVDVAAFRYDSQPPQVVVTPLGPQGKHGWFTDTVTLSFSPQDQPGLSGIATWGWRLDGLTGGTALSLTLASDMVHTVVVTATDTAGNKAQPVTHTIAVDSRPPLLTYTIPLEPGLSGWYTAALTVTFGLSDALSGPDTVYWQLDDLPVEAMSAPQPQAGIVVQVPVAEEGRHILTAHGEDMAGNRTETVVLNLKLDSLPPTTEAQLTPAAAPSGYYTAPVNIQLTAQDGPADTASGVSATWLRVNDGPWQPITGLTLTADGIYTINYFSFDLAGNVEISHSLTISLDASAPSAAIAPTVEPADWSANNRFTLRWQNPADLSGITGAYVWIGAGPPGPGDGIYYPLPDPQAQSAEIAGLAAPGEGEWPVWLWLVDGAGNRDRSSAVQAGILRHDATPPEVSWLAEGPAGNAGWFTGGVIVTLTLADTGSGPESLHYRLDGNPWQTSQQPQVTVHVDQSGKHVLDYYGLDVAGHSTGPARATLRIDEQPPRPPLQVSVLPTGWSATNQFTVTWRNPLDTSGVNLAYLSLMPPEGPRAGQPWLARSQMAVLQAPAEGAYDLYLWLEDLAGNVDQRQAAHLTDVVRFDASPPTTTVHYSTQPNKAGWFRSGVAVTLEATDAHSAVANTFWQLDEGPLNTGHWLFVDGDGQHTLRVYSRDLAGNSEAPQVLTLKIDSLAPTASLAPLPVHSTSPQIHVHWGGSDPLPGPASKRASYVPGNSGISAYNVEVRQGSSGPWQPWLTNTTLTEAVFSGQRGQVYAFRVQSIDRAGNRSAWANAGGRNQVLVDPVENGQFETQNWSGWQTHDGLQMHLLPESELMAGQTVIVTRLGSTHWQACASPGDLPTLTCGDTWSSIAQTVTVPSLSEVAQPTLSFWYRVQTYDVITTSSPDWARLCPQLGDLPFLVDTFDVTAQAVGADRLDLLWRDGNQEPQFGSVPSPNPPIPLRDLGWQLATIDLSPYAGRSIRLEFATHNRLDRRFNTWTDLYGIRVHGQLRRVFLPLALQEAPRQPEMPTYCYPLGEPFAPPLQPLRPDNMPTEGSNR